MKWRFPAHGTMHGTMRWMPLYDFIESFGLLVYPVALAGIAFSGFLLLRRRLMLFSLGVLAICLATLTRFVMLGVFRAALEF